jgi:hypothetical protein
MSNLTYSKARSYTTPYSGTKRREWEIETEHSEYRLTQSEGSWTLERDAGWLNARVLWEPLGRWQSANLREAKKMVADLIAGRVTL